MGQAGSIRLKEETASKRDLSSWASNGRSFKRRVPRLTNDELNLIELNRCKTIDPLIHTLGSGKHITTY
jgi:hypothetical protein